MALNEHRDTVGIERPEPRRLTVGDRIIQSAMASRLVTLGYYVATDLELPGGYDEFADVAGMRPLLKEVKKRYRLGPAPVGILHLLDRQEWTVTESIVDAAQASTDFIRGALLEAETKGWVEKRIVQEDVVAWRINDYSLPGRDVFLVRCGSSDVAASMEALKKMSRCCNQTLLMLDYEVDGETMDECVQNGIGLSVYVPRMGYTREILSPEYRDISDIGGAMSIAERLLFENYILRREDSI